LEFFKNNLKDLKNPLHKYLIIFSTYTMVKQVKLLPEDFFDILLNSEIFAESDNNYQLMEYVNDIIFEIFKLKNEEKYYSKFFQLYLLKFEHEINKEQKGWIFSQMIKLAKNVNDLFEITNSAINEKEIYITSENYFFILKSIIKNGKKELDSLKETYIKFLLETNESNTSKLYKKFFLPNYDLKTIIEIENIWNNYLDKKRQCQSYEFSYLAEALKISIQKNCFWDYFEKKFFKDLLLLIQNESFQISKEFFFCAFPDTNNFPFLIQQLYSVLDVIENSNKDFKKIILQKIDFLILQEKINAMKN
jgi:hypothetical protein